MTSTSAGDEGAFREPGPAESFADEEVVAVIPELRGADPPAPELAGVQCPNDWGPVAPTFDPEYSAVLDTRGPDSPQSTADAIVEYFTGGLEHDPYVDQVRVAALDRILIPAQHMTLTEDADGYPVRGPSEPRVVELADGRTVVVRMERMVVPWRLNEADGPLLLDAAVAVVNESAFELTGVSYCEIVSVSESTILSVIRGETSEKDPSASE